MKRASLLSLLAVMVLTLSFGLLLSAWASTPAQKAPGPAWANHEYQRYRFDSPERVKSLAATDRKLLRSSADGILRVDPGSREDAEKYYGEVAKRFPNFLATAQCSRTDFLKTCLPDVLAYFGYAPLRPADLQRLDPEVLMSYADLLRQVSNPNDFRGFAPIQKEELLVSRFFAPKIVSVKELPAKELGWRKVVWLKARTGSNAEKDRLDSFLLLFNFTSTTPTFPVGVDAGQIQAMITPRYGNPPNNHFSAYFLVYNALSGKCPEADANGQVVVKPCTAGQLGFHLTASFDANFLPQQNYFVPNACAQCHGTSGTGATNAKINYLDTDHWYDRVRPPDGDFKEVARKDVLVNGGSKALKVIYDLNTRIRAQNQAVSPGSFQVRAVEKWLTLHADCSGPNCFDKDWLPVYRGFKKPGSEVVWTPGNQTDEELIPLLNQNCFRCHSSFRFHVFEKATVAEKKNSIKSFVNSGYMPPDRQLSDATKKKIVDLIGKLP
ncbi:MAG TPA: hypothetical protein VF173_06970 [Thermoanaerobaculia bacterium]|nr:hypothetical protein [Thermoanaerobaculia bacterium]